MLLLNRNQSSDCFLIQMNDFYMIGTLVNMIGLNLINVKNVILSGSCFANLHFYHQF